MVISLKIRQQSTQQSVADENTSTNSHHDNINRQVPGNRENK